MKSNKMRVARGVMTIAEFEEENMLREFRQLFDGEEGTYSDPKCCTCPWGFNDPLKEDILTSFRKAANEETDVHAEWVRNLSKDRKV